MLTTLKSWWHQEDICTEAPSLELAATKLMVGMMWMDGNIERDEEREIIHLLHVRFGLSENEARTMLAQVEDESHSDVTFSKAVKEIESQYTQQERVNLLSHIWQIALADGDVDFAEERYINRLASLIGVPTDMLLNLKFEQEKNISNLNQSERFQNPNL